MDGFDFDRVIEAIENSDASGDAQKLVLSNAVGQARDNPAVLETVLTQIREAMGL